MSRKKHDKKTDLDKYLDEVLGRIVQTDPKEIDPVQNDGPVHLVEREGAEGQFLIYSSDRGAKVELQYQDGEPWFTQAQLAEIFSVDVRTINEHIQNFLDGGEIDAATIRDFRIVRQEGDRQVSRQIKHYGLDVAFYVGYRVNSAQGALFRRWATTTLIQFAAKGFVIDKERLKDPGRTSFVDELKEEIREIRASTQNVYREVRRICALCQDYDGSIATARNFFAGMENKLLWIATTHTAPELIVERADASQEEMGLTHYAGKRGPIQRDVMIANNYLTAPEAKQKNRATVMLLDYFEDQLDQGRLVTMVEAEDKLNEFIKFNNWPLLSDFGRVKRTAADRHAKQQLKFFKLKLSE